MLLDYFIIILYSLNILYPHLGQIPNKKKLIPEV
jgi:hypothetical protein